MPKYALVLLLFIFQLSIYDSYPQVKINEICPSNYKGYFDEENDDCDWIELFNSGSSAVNLKEYRIYDDYDWDNAFVLPDTVIEAGQRLIIFASDKNKISRNNYALESSGPGGTICDKTDKSRFEYLPVSGDFDISLRILSLKGVFEKEASFGLMLRDTLSKGSKYAGVFGRARYIEQVRTIYREEEGGRPKDIHFQEKYYEFPDLYLRLKKEGDSISSYLYCYGYLWHEGSKIAVDWADDTSYLGIFFSNAQEAGVGKIIVRDLILNGDTLDFNGLTKISLDPDCKTSSYFTNEIHSNFKMKRKEGCVILWNNYGKIISSVEYTDIPTNFSYGRYPDANSNSSFVYCQNPSPGETNKFGYGSFAPDVAFSQDGGWFDEEQELTLTTDNSKAKIYYTLNGAAPDSSSMEYNSPLQISKTTPVRAIAYASCKYPGRVSSHTFFINESSTMPVSTMFADSSDLWDEEYGLFTEANEESSEEIPVHFEYWDNQGNKLYNTDCGARLHGHGSRSFAQKSMRLYARDLYNNDDFDYPFFGGKYPDSFERLVLRNGGTDWLKAILRDGFANILASDIPGMIVTAYQPTVHYLNGEYWGILNLRERIDEKFLAKKYNVSEESIDYLQNYGTLKTGSAKKYNDFMDSLMAMDMQSAGAYDFLNNNIDMFGLHSYVIFEVFMRNIDWPNTNQRFFSSNEYDGKLRWVLNDLDLACGIKIHLDKSAMQRAVSHSSDFGKMLSKMMENEQFKIEYINRSADMINYYLQEEHCVTILDSLIDIYDDEIERHQAKWPESANDWEYHLDLMHTFLKVRPDSIFSEYCTHFELPGTYELSLNSNISGNTRFILNSLTIDSNKWSGKYFQGVPVKIKAIAPAGYTFSGWSDNSLAQESEIEISPSTDFNLTAIFINENDNSDTNIVINEILYKPNEDEESEDWIELLNKGNKVINLKGWCISDSKDSHVFTITENITLEPDSFLVICRDMEDFNEIYSDEIALLGDMDFGLGSEDMVRIYDANGYLRDSVSYTDEFPWPEPPSEGGYSIELINPNDDNALAESWKISDGIHGTPGKGRLQPETIASISNEIAELKVYPNPCGNVLNLFFSLDTINSIEINIFDINGNCIKETEIRQSYDQGPHTININTAQLKPGMYCIKIRKDNKEYIEKFIKI